MNKINLTGKKFGKWTVIKDSGERSTSRTIMWLCQCDCGWKQTVDSRNLIRGASTSCGCSRRIPGYMTSKESSEYMSWVDMIRRCTNPKHERYKDYGGRGIVVCGRWLISNNFLKDMGPKPIGYVLDRIDNDGNYEPTNCRWTDYSTSNLNKRKRDSTP